jgi:hypothetical protein
MVIDVPDGATDRAECRTGAGAFACSVELIERFQAETLQAAFSEVSPHLEQISNRHDREERLGDEVKSAMA